MQNAYISEEFFVYFSKGMMIIDKEKVITKVNPAYQEMIGYSEEEVLGKHLNVLNSEEHNKRFHQNIWKTVEKKGVWEGELWNRRKNGEVFLEKRTIFLNRGDNGNITQYIMFLRDITNEKIEERKMEELTYRDLVTGLPNRRLFEEILTSVLLKTKRSGMKLGVLFMDLNRFRDVNESFGYNIGDELLRQVADRLKKVIGEEAMLTRMGGDLFVIVFPDISQEKQIVTLLEKINTSFKQEPFILSKQEYYLTTSMGISIFPNDGESQSDLFRNADLARSRAKESGHNQYQFYTENLNSKVLERIMLEANLRKSIERNELVLYYQPQVEIQTGKVVSLEALIRWNHPEIGMIPPSMFIPLAEENGLIAEIGDWAIKEVCRQNKQLQEDPRFEKVVMAVNISARQFQKKDLVQVIKKNLEKTKLDPTYLEVEITESMVMKNVEQAIATLHELRSLGIKISIDDFGTGYSSLNQLAKFPLNYLKIDKSFIQNMHETQDSMTIVSAIIAMAHQLNLEVVAEGVERKEHIEILRKLRCEKYQGFFFSQPVPLEGIKKILLEQKNKNT